MKFVIMLIAAFLMAFGAMLYAGRASHNDGVSACKARGFAEYDTRDGMLCIDPKTRAIYAP